MTVSEYAEKLTAKRKELAEFLKKREVRLANGEIAFRALEGENESAVVEEFRRREAEINELAEKWETAKKMAETYSANDEELKRLTSPKRPPYDAGDGAGDSVKAKVLKGIGDLLVESEGYKSWRPGAVSVVAFEWDALGYIKATKALFETGAGWAPPLPRIDRVALTPERRLVVADLPSAATTSDQKFEWMEETTLSDTAAETAEGGAYPEQSFALTARTETLRKITAWVPVTDEQLRYVDQARGYLNARLTSRIERRLDSQLLNGNGVAPNILGYLNKTGISTQAKGVDTALDAIYKGIVKVQDSPGFSEPDAIVMNATDWQTIRLAKTTDGIYIMGSPTEAGAPRLWGLPVVITSAISAGTALIGSFREHSQLWLGSTVEVKWGFINDDFIKGKNAVRADLYATLAIYRPPAFCKVTGL